MNINHITIVGRVVRDPQLKAMTNGNSVVNMDIATSRVWYDKDKQKQEETEFHKIVAYGRTADIIGQYCTKGQLVAVEGRLKTRNWEGKDGIKRYQTETIVEKLQLGPKSQAKAEPIETVNVESGYMDSEKSKKSGMYQKEDKGLPVLEEEGEEDTKVSDDIPF